MRMMITVIIIIAPTCSGGKTESHLLLTLTHPGQCYHCPHLTDEVAEAQRSHSASKCQNWDLNPRLSNSKDNTLHYSPFPPFEFVCLFCLSQVGGHLTFASLSAGALQSFSLCFMAFAGFEQRQFQRGCHDPKKHFSDLSGRWTPSCRAVLSLVPELHLKPLPSLEGPSQLVIPGDILRSWPKPRPWNWPSS